MGIKDRLTNLWLFIQDCWPAVLLVILNFLNLLWNLPSEKKDGTHRPINSSPADVAPYRQTDCPNHPTDFGGPLLRDTSHDVPQRPARDR